MREWLKARRERRWLPREERLRVQLRRWRLQLWRWRLQLWLWRNSAARVPKQVTKATTHGGQTQRARRMTRSTGVSMHGNFRNHGSAPEAAGPSSSHEAPAQEAAKESDDDAAVKFLEELNLQ